MNHNNLKRRRPFGPDDDPPIVPAHQNLSPSSQPQIALFHHSYYRSQIEQVASIYGLTGLQLHQIAYQEYLRQRDGQENNTRQKPLPAYSMSSQFAGSSQAQDFPEKSQQAAQHGHHGLAGVDAGPSSSGWHSDLTQGLTERMASLFGSCQNCFETCMIPIPEGYQLIHESNIVGYGSNTGYEVEKPPTAGLPPPEAYVPAAISQGEPDPFAMGDPQLMSTYVPNYQSVQESPNQGLAAAPAVPNDLVYSADVTANPYYPDVPNATAPTHDGSHNFSNAAGHLVPTNDVLSSPYSDNMMSIAMPPTTIQHQTPMPVTAAGFSMATPYVMQDMGVKDEVIEQPAMPSTPARLDIVYSHQRPPASKRGPFKDIKQRQETANTRKTGSCIRCRMQRIRCVPDPVEPQACCMTCRPKANSNKQVIRQPCIRAKITEVKCMKPGQVRGLEWTLRWGENGPVDNISTWASNDVKTIRVTEGYTRGMSVQLHVREFVPQPGDKLDRSWVTEDGVKKSVMIPPYAITNLDEAQSAYQEYIKRGVVDCFTTVIEQVMGARDRLLYATYRKAWEVSQDPRTAPEERELLIQTLQLWMAVRLTTKSVEIVGNETLGMDHDILDQSSPQHGSIPLPPVMGAQLDLVLIQHIQTRLRREMLEKFQKMTQQNKQKTWLTTYLVTFILLHNIALLTDHDASYAKKHGMKTKFARESDVQDYHYGGTILLAYFHYCNKGIFPFTEECRDQDLRQLAQLDDQALQFVQWTRSQVMAHKREWDDLREANEYGQPYFFVSQLFRRDWLPQAWVQESHLVGANAMA